MFYSCWIKVFFYKLHFIDNIYKRVGSLWSCIITLPEVDHVFGYVTKCCNLLSYVRLCIPAGSFTSSFDLCLWHNPSSPTRLQYTTLNFSNGFYPTHRENEVLVLTIWALNKFVYRKMLREGGIFSRNPSTHYNWSLISICRPIKCMFKRKKGIKGIYFIDKWKYV